jgi:hypothetical protein
MSSSNPSGGNSLNPLNNLAPNSKFGRMAQFGMGMIGSQENSNGNNGGLALGRHKF